VPAGGRPPWQIATRATTAAITDADHAAIRQAFKAMMGIP
jgi:hypothetical protein